MNRIDHIVIAADSLAQGVDYVRKTFGVDIPRGGFHKTMGTHNHLMQLGDEVYLELIAIDPQAEAPRHPRWFGLDQALMRQSLKQRPRLITWVMNTPDIGQLVSQASLDPGCPTALSRDSLRWEIALSDDGRLLADGLLPYCIQWHSRPHPSQGMAQLGCTLQSLTIHHNRPQWTIEKLESIGASHLVVIESISDSETAYLSAKIDTPNGVITIDSRV